MLPVNTCNCVSGYCSTCCDCCKHIVPHTLVENVALCKTSDESKHQASGKFAVFGILHKKKGCYFLQGDARVVPCSQLAMDVTLNPFRAWARSANRHLTQTGCPARTSWGSYEHRALFCVTACARGRLRGPWLGRPPRLLPCQNLRRGF